LNILLVRLRQIGDVAFTTPAVRALRQHFPYAHIAYLVEPAAQSLVAHNTALDEVIVAPRTSGWRGLVNDVRLGARLRRARFDLAIDFHGGPRASLLTWLSGAPRRIGYEITGRSWMYTERVSRPRALRARHSVENQWDLLVSLGLPPASRDRFPVEMPIDPDAAVSVAAKLAACGYVSGDRLAVLHVSAGNPFRRWPIESFGEVAASLIARHPGLRVIVTSGPSEIDAAAKTVEAARARLTAAEQPLVAAPDDLSLAELRALVERAALYIGGDSGPMHIAATSSVPIVSLYGPTLPARSEPWRARPERAIAVEIADLPCRPCEQRTCEPGDFRCLGRIQPSAVLDAAERLLSQTGQAG
jgi:lipopolysaccharide heptosyltransferase II